MPGFKAKSFTLLKLMGIEIPKGVKIGKRVRFEHWAYGTVIHPFTVIEDNVKVYQGVTIGIADVYRSYKDCKWKNSDIKDAFMCWK